jgi:hypothetical protein
MLSRVVCSLVHKKERKIDKKQNGEKFFPMGVHLIHGFNYNHNFEVTNLFCGIVVVGYKMRTPLLNRI